VEVKKMKVTEKKVKSECPQCGSKNILYNRGEKIFWCRVCGEEWKKGVKK
jgi:ribosomal protein L37AE/L43A